MGSLKRFDLASLIERYELTCLVETGTGQGTSLLYAQQFAFTRLVSFEVHARTWEWVRANVTFAPHVEVRCADSVSGLRDLLPEIAGERCLFFLDAHFPGEFYHGKADLAQPVDQSLPLQREIETLTEGRDVSRDVLILDDLRIYEPGDYGRGDVPLLRRVLGVGGIEFVERAVAATHDVVRVPHDEGYCVALPKGVPAPPLVRESGPRPDAADREPRDG